MSGTTVIDRRDLERLLKHLVHAEKRDDVKVDIKFYVQFSTGDDYSASTLLDPWQPFSRSAARNLIKAAIVKLDEEETKTDARTQASNLIANAEGPISAEAIPAAGEEPDKNCVTTPDGGCIGGPCMHDPAEVSLEGLEGAAL